MIPTGGSSGQIRFAIHTWETLMASVRGFHQYFGETPINSVCVLPLYHVSGLMQFLRSLTTGGRLVILPFKALAEGDGHQIDPTDFFISLVPTQLARLISPNPSSTLLPSRIVGNSSANNKYARDTTITPPLVRGAGGVKAHDISPAAAWLSRFRAVLLGGAPAWADLLEQAKRYSIPLAPTYGMTETASQIVTLKPKDFLSGNNSCGQVLPHAQVTIRDSTGKILDAKQTGVITIQADSLALGYYSQERWGDGNPLPNPKSKIQNLKSDDLGFLDEQGYLTVLGRDSNKIITGGENVFPAEVEAPILATQLVTDVCIIGLPDHYWGQAVTAIYVPNSSAVSPALLQIAIADKLTKFKCPKYWIPIESLPRNAQGKINHEQLKKILNDGFRAELTTYL